MNTKFKINDFVEQKSTNIKLKIIDVQLDTVNLEPEITPDCSNFRKRW